MYTMKKTHAKLIDQERCKLDSAPPSRKWKGAALAQRERQVHID